MSIADKLTKLRTDIDDSYDAVAEQGGTVPTQKNTENLAPAILSIPKGGGSGIGLVAIYIETAGKTQYDLGDFFSLDEYVIKAVYTNEAQKEVTSSCTFTPNRELAVNDTTVTISYTEDGVTKTVTQQITVIEYEQLVNYTMLYDAGDECIDVTGGWSVTSSRSGDITKNESNLYFTNTKSGTDYSTHITTINSIDNSNYKYLYWSYMITAYGSNGHLESFIQHATDTYVKPCYRRVKSGGVPLNVKKFETGRFTTSGVLEEKEVVSNYSSPRTVRVNFSVGVGTGLKAYVYNVLYAKQDNWQELCTIAGLNSSNYADETALCADSTAIATILNSQDAVNFMIYNCTGTFMCEFVANSTCLTALNESSYKTIIQANEHWNKFLNMVA